MTTSDIMEERNPPPYKEDSTVQIHEKACLEKDEEAPPYTDSTGPTHALTVTASASSSASATHGKRGPKLATVPIDSSRPLNPTRIFWIPWFSSFSKKLSAYDITGPMAGHWQGAVNKEYRELAKAMYDKYQKASDAPAYSAVATGGMRHRYSFRDAAGAEVCEWKHGWSSVSEVGWTFPAESKRGGLGGEKVQVVRGNKILTRDRVFTVNGAMYAVEMDSSWRSNQWTIWKLHEGSRFPFVRFGMKYGGAWFTGGCVAVDAEQLDEALAVLACLVIMRQNKQRAAERSSNGGGGGGGGG